MLKAAQYEQSSSKYQPSYNSLLNYRLIHTTKHKLLYNILLQRRDLTGQQKGK